MAGERRRAPFIQDFDVYHDESQIGGYWHGILFVPRSERQHLLDRMAAIRSATEYPHPISLKNLNRPSGRMYRCIRGWLQLGVAALIQNLKGGRYGIFTGEDKRLTGYGTLDKVIGIRLGIFRIREGLSSLGTHPDYGSKVETTFRMGLKGCLKQFSGAPWRICSLHFDNHEQYGRRIDLARIRNRIGDLPPEIEFSSDVSIDDRSSDHARSECQNYEDCQLLQLTDLLVGGFRSALGHATRDDHARLCAPLEKLASDWRLGPARMRNSRWNKGYCLSEAYLEGGQWRFDLIRPVLQRGQPDLFDGIFGEGR